MIMLTSLGAAGVLQRAALDEYEPTPTEIEEQKHWIRIRDRANFADQLSIARKMWQKYPELVEEDQIPEPYFSAYKEMYEGEHPEDFSLSDEALAEDFEITIIAEAREFAICRHKYLLKQRHALNSPQPS